MGNGGEDEEQYFSVAEVADSEEGFEPNQATIAPMTSWS